MSRLLKVTLLLIVFGDFGATRLAAQTSSKPRVSGTVSKTSVQVAEPFTFEIRCIAPANARVSFPAVPKNLGEFDVIDHQDRFDVPLDSSSDRSWTRYLTLESITTGKLPLPSVEVQVGIGEKTTRLETKSRTINVLSVLEGRPDPKSFRDVRPLVDVAVEPDKSYTWIGWTAGGIAGAILLVGSVFVLMRRGRFISPAQWAQRELDELAKPSVTPTDSIDRLSEIMREFLSLQTNIAAPNLTTDELLRTLQSSEAMDTETTSQLADLFQKADQAKYAGVGISESDLQDLIQNARELVEHLALQTNLSSK